MTGDLSANGRPSELREALAALDQLARSLGLPRERVVLLPGDRDVNRDACAAYFSDCLAEEREPVFPYRPKWRSFAAAFQSFYAGVEGPAFSESEPWSLFEIPELRVAVAALNSTTAESHLTVALESPGEITGLLGEEQLRWFAGAIEPYRRRGWLCLAALHHPLEQVRDAEAFQRILGGLFDRVLHGHGEAPAQVLYLEPGRPDPEASREESREEKRAEPKNQEYDRFESGERDDFLARVEVACRLREPGAEVRRLREAGSSTDSITDSLEYLRVSHSEGGMVRLYPVGALEHGADPAAVAAFVERVDARYREGDSGLVSLLVYNGEPPAPPEMVRAAAERRVRLLSFLEFQGLIDFRAYVGRQSDRLHQDPVYPPSLYVPQRMRYTSGIGGIGGIGGLGEEETGDAAGMLLEWLASPHGRFILAVGDSGAGKSFLLREVARRLAEQKGLIPILIELRHLEKARTLDQLLGQHFAREGVEDFSPVRFRYMLEQGRIALLFDGFDELATRVTYGRAAEHFDTLLQAASGAAKVVVTSRRQHFESARQVKTLLGEQVELLAGRRIAFVQPFDREQIRGFLVRLTGDRERGEARLAMIEQVGDLAGLAHNPRMLGFIAELPEERLRRASSLQGEITAASLYRLLLGRWLGQELDRAHPDSMLAPPLLSFSERLEAVTRIALRLWRTEDASLRLSELTEEVSRAVAALRRGPIDAEAAAFQVGSGTLLVRDDDGGFSFLHPSVLEWLVARRASEELAMESPAETLASREMSPLMADFFVALAGHETALAWARRALIGDGRDAAKSNALLVLHRLGEEMREPVDLAGRDLRGKDLSGEDLPGADLTAADLSAARLRGTRLTAARLSRAKLRGADLTQARLDGADLRGADLTGARLLGADLRGALLDGAVLRRAKLIGALREGSLAACDLLGAALAVPPAAEGIAGSVAAALPCQAVAWSPDGDLLATADGHLVRLWDAATGREIRRLAGHDGLVRAVAWSPDGDLLASASHDRTVRVWEVVTGRERIRLWGHASWVSSVAFHPGGDLLASGSYDRTARLWHPRTGSAVRTLPGHGSWVLSVAWNRDGKRLATGCADAAVRLWSTASGELERELTGHQDWVRSVAWGVGEETETLLASASDDRTARIWETETGRELHRLAHQDLALAVAWSPGGETLASASEDRIVRLWDARTGREERRALGHGGRVPGLAWSPDGKALATGSSDRTVRLWTVPALQETRRFPCEEHWVSGIAFAPDGATLAAASHDRAARLWDVRTGRELRRFRQPGERLWGIAFRPDGWTLAGACDDGTVALWSTVEPDSAPLEGRRLMGRCLRGHTGRVLSVAWSPDGTALASGSADRTVRLWNAADGRETHRLTGATSGIRSVAWSPDGTALAGASGDPDLRLWDAGTGREIRRLSGHQSNALSVAWSPGGANLAAGCIDGALVCWDLASGEETLRLKGHTESVWAAAWSPDGRTLASGSFDGTVRLWDITVGQERHCFDGHSHRVLSLAWSPDGALLASGSADNTIRLWDVAAGRCLAVLGLLAEGWVAFTPDGRYKLGGVPAGGFWHTIALCRFEPGELDPWVPGLRMADDENLPL